jgi:hypothetical protein
VLWPCGQSSSTAGCSCLRDPALFLGEMNHCCLTLATPSPWVPSADVLVPMNLRRMQSNADALALDMHYRSSTLMRGVVVHIPKFPSREPEGAYRERRLDLGCAKGRQHKVAAIEVQSCVLNSVHILCSRLFRGNCACHSRIQARASLSLGKHADGKPQFNYRFLVVSQGVHCRFDSRDRTPIRINFGRVVSGLGRRKRIRVAATNRF